MGKVFTITEGLENMGALKTGGQGSVYKGRRIGEIITAVKLLPTPIHSESHTDKNYIDFQNEVQKLKKVNEEPNPNVVKILSFGLTESGSFPFIEMEFIEGPDLEELLQPPHEAIFTIKEVIKVAEQLSNALAHCHKVNVKHGDVKSNNVKFNKYTGNFVLLDFGLAIMSDEQRRTSLRHAGAVEFMAPEQSEGELLFESDVYSFGVILFELLAGQVPFPLLDKGETARNRVMLAHMENNPPDVLTLRRNHLPSAWSEEMKNREMHVPDWLLEVIYKCLDKKPENRFANGTQLHEFITQNRTLKAAKSERSAEQVFALQQQNQKLLREKEQLQQLLANYQQASLGREQAAASKTTTYYPKEIRPKGKSAFKKGLTGFILVVALILLVVFSLSKNNQSTKNSNAVTAAKPEKPKRVIGQFKVVSPRAYFHNDPNEDSRRSAYMIPSNDVVTAYEEKNGFVYTEFTNNKGQTSKGWLDKNDLISLEEWNKNNKFQEKARPIEQDIDSQLKDARNLLANNQTKEALYIYSYLAEQEVPEAMYQYGNLALQNKNDDIDCIKALSFIKRASEKGYVPAKRTLGFLYLFAENQDVLHINDYDHCTYEKNVVKGMALLMEAVTAGDTTARRLMDEVNVLQQQENAGPQ